MSTTGQLRTDVVKKQPVTSGGTTSGATLISVSVIISAYLGCSVNGHDVNCTEPSVGPVRLWCKQPRITPKAYWQASARVFQGC